MIADLLARVAREYVYERAKPIADNELANMIRRDLALEGRKLVSMRAEDYRVKASPGPNVWASVPWLGFFDTLVTETAQKGFYVVFLINPDTQDIYLSLNQGTTEIEKEFGRKQYLDVLTRRAADIRARVKDVSHGFSDEPIHLGSSGMLPEGYEAGHALGLKFRPESIQDDAVDTALQQMLHIYSMLVERGGTIPTDMMTAEAQTSEIDEARKYILSRRIERSRKVRSNVLTGRPLACDACGLDPQKDYSYNGRRENVPLDVHHLTPLVSLREGELRRFKIPDDFAVLCPTCHRVIHKQADPSDLDALRRTIRFRHMREMF